MVWSMAFYNFDKINDNVGVLDVIQKVYGSRVNKLTVKGGGKAVCCCPIHDDQNPSFNIDNNHWVCWSQCGNGDVIDFVQKMERLPSKPEACAKLIDLMGLDPNEYVTGGKNISPAEQEARQAEKTVKLMVSEISKLQESYANGSIEPDDYDKALAPLMKMWEENLSKMYKKRTIDDSESKAFATAFQSRIPKWLEQGSKIYKNGNALVVKGKDIPLYTRKGTKLADSYSNIIVSPGIKGVFGAFVEIDPIDNFLASKDIHPDDLWKISKQNDKPNYYSLRYNSPDFSGCVIYAWKKDLFTGAKRAVTDVNTGAKSEKFLPPLFHKDKWYISVHDVLDVKTLQRTMPEKFPSIQLPEYLNHPCFKPTMCIVYKLRGQDTICKYKLHINEKDVYIKESKWDTATVSRCLAEAGKNMDLFEDKLFDTANVRVISMSDSNFEKFCEFMKQSADKSPAILNTDNDCISLISKMTGKMVDNRTEDRSNG